MDIVMVVMVGSIHTTGVGRLDKQGKEVVVRMVIEVDIEVVMVMIGGDVSAYTPS